MADDFKILDSTVDDLLRRSEALAALIIDKSGALIRQRGAVGNFDTTTIAALAAGSFGAGQALAERLGETNFSNIHQQGEHHSLLICNIDANALLVIIFQAEISVGAVKQYASAAVKQAAVQLQKVRQRSARGTPSAA